MKTKAVITAILLTFVSVSVGYLAVKEFRPRPNEPDPSEEAMPSPPESPSVPVPEIPVESDADHKVVAYYFHGNVRCMTCRAIEAYAHEALETAFPESLRSGELEWRVLNVEQPGNEHFIQDYELSTRSVVLVDTVGGQQKEWKNLRRVWELVRDKPAFLAYVQDETRTYLGSS